jgi:dihydrolipoamide dehydrogenase
VLTSDHALAMTHVPASAIVVGGGAIGAELTQVWRALGAEVTVVEAQPTLVPAEDRDLGRELRRALRRRGIDVLVDATLEDVDVRDDQVQAVIRAGGHTQTVSAEVLLLAIGRDPASDFGFADAGIRLDDGYVTPQSWATLESSVGGVHAVGDLLPLPALARANTAYAEGRLVAERISGIRGPGLDYTRVARVTHGVTETAAVGVSEERARELGADVRVATMPLGSVARGLMIGDGGMLKVIADAGGEFLGIAMVGPHATELIGEALLLTGFEATAADLAPLVHPHPTLTEAFGEVGMALAGRPMHWRA